MGFRSEREFKIKFIDLKSNLQVQTLMFAENSNSSNFK